MLPLRRVDLGALEELSTWRICSYEHMRMVKPLSRSSYLDDKFDLPSRRSGSSQAGGSLLSPWDLPA
jgi:hypothetical protein